MCLSLTSHALGWCTFTSHQCDREGNVHHRLGPCAMAVPNAIKVRGNFPIWIGFSLYANFCSRPPPCCSFCFILVLFGYPWTGRKCSNKPHMNSLDCFGGMCVYIFVFFAVCSPSAHTLTMVRFTSPLSLRREDSFITLDLNEIFSVLMQNFAFLPRKLIFPMVRVSGFQGL